MTKHTSYLSFEKSDGKPSVSGFFFAESLEEIRGWQQPETQPNPAIETKSAKAGDESGEPVATFTSEAISLMRRFKETLSGYHALINLNAVMPSMIEAITVENRVLGFAKSQLQLVSECDRFATYGVSDDKMLAVYRLMAEFREQQVGYGVIPGSVMLSLVATVDSLVADFMRLLLKTRPERFARSDKNVAVRDVLAMTSFDELIEKLIEDEIDQIMRGSHTEQVKFIEANFKVEIRDRYERWSNFVEIFERRNLVAHGNCVVNRIYLANCRTAGCDVSGVAIGDELLLAPEYLHEAVDILTEFGVLLIFKIALNSQPADREELYSQMNHITFELIRTGRHKLAAWLLDFSLNKQSAKISDSTLKMMTVNLANALRKSDQEERCKEILDGTDWTATSDNYQICVAALRDDVDGFVKLMERVQRAGTVTAAAFREWPVFDWVRKQEAVQSEFQRLFGEPLLKAPVTQPTQITVAGDAVKKEKDEAPEDLVLPPDAPIN